jgi:hypothetical protein
MDEGASAAASGCSSFKIRPKAEPVEDVGWKRLGRYPCAWRPCTSAEREARPIYSYCSKWDRPALMHRLLCSNHPGWVMCAGPRRHRIQVSRSWRQR